MKAQTNGFEILCPPEGVESRESKVEQSVPQECVRQPAQSLAVGI
jgi:hypothetical protein